MTTTSKTIDMLNTLLRAERAAVETHMIAIDRLSRTAYADALRENLVSHDRRVGRLSAEIVKQGGEPVETSGIWGTFAKLLEGSASAFSERAAIAALEEGEDRGHESYKQQIEHTEGTNRAFIQGLLKEQHQSHEMMSKLRRTMGDDSKFAQG